MPLFSVLWKATMSDKNNLLIADMSQLFYPWAGAYCCGENKDFQLGVITRNWGHSQLISGTTPKSFDWRLMADYTLSN